LDRFAPENARKKDFRRELDGGSSNCSASIFGIGEEKTVSTEASSYRAGWLFFDRGLGAASARAAHANANVSAWHRDFEEWKTVSPINSISATRADLVRGLTKAPWLVTKTRGVRLSSYCEFLCKVPKPSSPDVNIEKHDDHSVSFRPSQCGKALGRGSGFRMRFSAPWIQRQAYGIIIHNPKSSTVSRGRAESHPGTTGL